MAEIHPKRSVSVSEMGASVAEFVHAGWYARPIPGQGRLETFEDTVSRTESMHLERFDLSRDAEGELRWAFDLVRARRVLPAMRSLRYAGEAIFRDQARLYNTWAAPCDYPRVFAEAFYLLMCGGGIGYSVQRQHVERLPPVALESAPGVKAGVEDSIRGWAEALDLLISAQFRGADVAFDTSAIRPAGSPIRTAGGLAPGPQPFLTLCDHVRRIFRDARGRRLRPIECYDLFCHVAQAALAGGTGRSAQLCMFSPDDDEMIRAKSGRWFEVAPWRRYSNNSAALLRHRSDRRAFDAVVDHAKEWGDPGVFWVDDLDVCSNSCVEVGFYPRLKVRSEHLARLAPRYPTVRAGDELGGFQGATLSEINGASLRSVEDFVEAARAAAIINTVQAAYTSFPFLGPVSELLCERDAMLGVGITGLMTGARLGLDPAAQRRAATEVVATNDLWASRLGIAKAARCTLIKPAGKTSLLFGCVSQGIHPFHGKRYFFRLKSPQVSPALQHFRRANQHMCADSGDNCVVTFPLGAPEGSIHREDLSAVSHLEIIRSTIDNWIRQGDRATTPATHNVSSTVTVRPGEWEDVREYLWRWQGDLGGVALMGVEGEFKHPEAPLQTVQSDEMAAWSQMHDTYTSVDYASLQLDEAPPRT